MVTLKVSPFRQFPAIKEHNLFSEPVKVKFSEDSENLCSFADDVFHLELETSPKKDFDYELSMFCSRVKLLFNCVPTSLSLFHLVLCLYFIFSSLFVID